MEGADTLLPPFSILGKLRPRECHDMSRGSQPVPPDVLPLRAEVLRCRLSAWRASVSLPVRMEGPVLGLESVGQEGATGSVVTDSGAGDGGQAQVPRQSPAAQEPVRRPAGQQAGGPLGRICAGRRPGEPLQGEKPDGGQGSSEAPQAMLVLCGVSLEAPDGDGEGDEPLQLTAIPDPSLESVDLRLTLVHTLRYSDPTYQ